MSCLTIHNDDVAGRERWQGMNRVMEIILYQLRPGTGCKFHQVMSDVSVPLHQSAGIEVLNFGNSLHSGDAYFLIRAFDNLEQMATAKGDFYSCDAWQNGPRSAILDSIESSVKSVLSLDEYTFTNRTDK